MNDPAPGATDEYSRASLESRGAREARRPASAQRPGALVWGLILAGVAGAVLLAAAEFANVVHITVAGNEVEAQTGGDRHSYALLLLAALAGLMAFGAAAKQSRPAMTAMAVVGLIAIVIALIGDAPHLDDTGVYGDRYSAAGAEAQVGFYLETLGGVLLVVAGVMLLSLTAHTRPARGVRSETERATSS